MFSPNIVSPLHEPRYTLHNRCSLYPPNWCPNLVSALCGPSYKNAIPNWGGEGRGNSFTVNNRGAYIFQKSGSNPKKTLESNRVTRSSKCHTVDAQTTRRYRTEFSRLGFLHRWSSIKLTNRPINVHGSLGHSEGTFISCSPVLLPFFKPVIHPKKATGYWPVTWIILYVVIAIIFINIILTITIYLTCKWTTRWPFRSHTSRSLLDSLQTKRRPLYLKTQSVPRCKHFSSRLQKPISLCCKWHKSLFVLRPA